jgi:hypothetical protein
LLFLATLIIYITGNISAEPEPEVKLNTKSKRLADDERTIATSVSYKVSAKTGRTKREVSPGKYRHLLAKICKKVLIVFSAHVTYDL